MSGIEIAGLILGALPILIEAVGAYKKSLAKGKLIFGVRKIVEKFALALVLHQRTIFETVRAVLKNSGCGDSLPLDAAPLLHVCDDEIGSQILEYLGTENYEALLALLAQTDEVLRRVTGHLEGALPDSKDPTTSLSHLIQAHRSSQDADIRFLFKVRLMFDMSELKETINELDKIVASFSQFVTIVLSNRIPVEHDVSRKSKKLGKFLHNIRRLAVDLHTALMQSWKPGCHAQHKVGLSLEDRVDGLSALSFKEAQLLTSTSIFQLKLASEPMHGHIAWFEAPCQIAKDLVYLDPSDSFSQQRSGVTFVIPSPTTSSTSLSPSAIVDDMCTLLDSVRNGNNHINLLLTSGPKITSTQAISQGLRYHTHADTVPLEGLLGDRSILTLKDRMILALQLVSSFLQLAQTGWTRSCWTKTSIHFLQLKGTTVPCLDLSHALVLSDFSGVSETPEASSEDPILQHDQAALVELGIILLELWHNQTLESRFPFTQNSESHSRWISALEWLKDADQPPPLYDKAVCHCVRGVFGNESRFTGHTDPKFWAAFCNDVIQPLYDNCKQWRST